MRFWDSSALVLLLTEETITGELQHLLSQQRQMYVSWATEVEAVSAITRYERKRGAPELVAAALDRLRDFSADWIEVAPGAAIREAAKRSLRVHPLRAADAFQLAAAWVLSEGNPSSVDFVCLDQRLREAASREGFIVRPAKLPS